MNYKLLTALLFTINLFGCTIPGGHIKGVSAGDSEVTNEDGSEKEPFDITEQVNTILVTPEILSSIKKAEPVAKQNLALNKQLSEYEYKVGVSDVLSIVVYDHPELTTPAGQFRSPEQAGNLVHSDGTIFYPYIGKMSVVGKNTAEIRWELAQHLAKYLEKPQLDVTIAAYRSKRAYITGAVAAPAVLPIVNIPLTVLDAINQVGGIRDDADWRSVIITRDSVDERLDLYALYQKGDMSQNRLLQHNDIIHVPRNDTTKVFVMGEVKRASTLQIERGGLSLAEALGNVGGFNEMTADASGIFVLRGSKEPGKIADVYQLDASNAAALILATQFQLEPMDLVYVTSAPIARWNKVISLLLPTVRGLDDLNDLENDL